MLQVGQVDGVLTEILEVVLSNGGELDPITRMRVEPFLGGIHGNVRTVKADPHEEGLVVFLLQLLDGPLGAFHVGHLVVVVRKDSPVP